MGTDHLPSVTIQTTPTEDVSIPAWLAEVVLLVRYCTHYGLLTAIRDHVRLARGRAGTFDVVDFVAILFGYAVSGEATLEAFCERLAPFAQPVLALFGRAQVPHRSSLSRFLAAIDPPCLEALRQQFQADLLQHGITGDAVGGFWDAQGTPLVVFDIDGTRQAARQRALAHAATLPVAQRRMDAVCAPGYPGRKRGEVVRTRTTVLQAHTQEWLGTFGNPGNGDYALELEAGCRAIAAYCAARQIPPAHALIRLDGLYGTLGLLARIHPFQLGFLTRGRDYQVLDHPTVHARLQQPADATVTHLASQVQRELFDVGFIADWLPEQPDVVVTYRGLVTRRAAPADHAQITVGKLRDAHVYELFLTSRPAHSLPATTVLELYQHRGAFEQVLSDEDTEQAPDRWCSHTPCGQEFWQILSQWVWNIRLRLGRIAQPQPLRWTTWEPERDSAATTTDPAAVVPVATESAAAPPAATMVTPEVAPSPLASVPPPLPSACVLTPPSPSDLVPIYGPLALAQPWAKARRRFSSQDFQLQEGDTLICPAGKILRPRERRIMENGDLRMLYAAKAHDCRTCPQAGDCMGQGASGAQPRRVSGVRHRTGWQLPPPAPATAVPPPIAEPHPDVPERRRLQWGDCGGRRVRRELVAQLRRQQVTLTVQEPTSAPEPAPAEPAVTTKAERAHRRRSWASRLAGNARRPTASHWHITVPGVPVALADALGLSSAEAA
ncbi:MAG: hypothetical protein AB4911_14105 [Oscillochloridaceae bacterium umkhey_bin13]